MVIFMFEYLTLELVKVQGYNAYLQWFDGRLNSCSTVSDSSGTFCEYMTIYLGCLFRQGYQNRPCIGCVENHDDWLANPCQLPWKDTKICDHCGDCVYLGYHHCKKYCKTCDGRGDCAPCSSH